MNINWQKQLSIDITTLSEATQKIGNTNDFYVYIIWKTYTEIPTPFYVGKGHLQRIIKHGMKSDENSNIYKTKIFNKHKRLGLKCGYSIHSFYDDEEESLQKEIDLILLIGRADLKQGPLANKTDGGDGTLGHLAPKGGDSYSARPVYANGSLYLCLKDAADALKIGSGAVSSRINNGWDGYYYQDEGQIEPTKKILGRYKKEVVVENILYPSASDAARKLNIDVRMISKRINYGWDGYYYTDKGQLPRKTIWGTRKDKVSITIKNKFYETVNEASLKTGESVAMISKRCLSSNYPDYVRLDGKVNQKLSAPKVALKLIIEDHIYLSVGEAAKAYDMTTGGITARCASSNYPSWNFFDLEVQKKKEKYAEFSSNPIKVNIDNIAYESQSSAARAHDIDVNTAKKRFKSLSFPNWICSSITKQEPKDGRRGIIHVEIDGEVFRSISAASKKLGESRPNIKKKIESTDYGNYKYL